MVFHIVVVVFFLNIIIIFLLYIYIWCQQLARIVNLSTWYSPSNNHSTSSKHLLVPLKNFHLMRTTIHILTDINIKLYISHVCWISHQTTTQHHVQLFILYILLQLRPQHNIHRSSCVFIVSGRAKIQYLLKNIPSPTFTITIVSFSKVWNPWLKNKFYKCIM